MSLNLQRRALGLHTWKFLSVFFCSVGFPSKYSQVLLGSHAFSFPGGTTWQTVRGWCSMLSREQSPVTWWASAKFPLRIQDASSDSGGENIMGMMELWGCGCNRLSSSTCPDTALRLPSGGWRTLDTVGRKHKSCHLSPPSYIFCKWVLFFV